MGLVLLFGLIMLGFGISFFAGAFALYKIAKRQGKTVLCIISVIGLLISIVMVAAGALLIIGTIQYISAP